jgi:hypothetical protein
MGISPLSRYLAKLEWQEEFLEKMSKIILMLINNKVNDNNMFLFLANNV